MTIYPTVLYIKQHSVTGLKYFGKTTAKDPYKYKGSGPDWVLHLKENGSEHVITTIVFGPCTDSEVISKWATEFSIKNNIVKSDKYANRKIENGLDGAVAGEKGKPCSAETKQKISDALIGRTQSAETKQKIHDTLKGKPSPLKGRPSPKKGKPSPNKGRPSPKKGKPCSTETKQKMRKPHGPHKQVECPHCGTIGGISAMKRWHFDTCPKKPY